MEKTIKTLVKINKVVNIMSLVGALGSIVVTYITGNISAAIAWTCCSLWIWNVMKTERLLASAETQIEQMKK
jgi:hypothetical protein